VEPTPRALPVTVVGNKNTDTVVPLTANVPIPDANELNWVLNVPPVTSATVKSVRVDVYGLWHEHASDLTYVCRVDASPERPRAMRSHVTALAHALAMLLLTLFVLPCALFACCLGRVTLGHGSKQVVLAAGGGGRLHAMPPSPCRTTASNVCMHIVRVCSSGDYTYGKPRLPTYPQQTQRERLLGGGASAAVEGDGLTYSWQDRTCRHHMGAMQRATPCLSAAYRC
jgi:hypothetical protein